MSDKNATEVVSANVDGIERAARILEAGGLVAVPTETVYGLAARADSAAAAARIYEAKGRPSFNPLIVHVRDAQQAAVYAAWNDHADRAAARFWPGPLTLVLPKKDNADLAAAVTAGLDTVALRAPAHPVMQALLSRVNFPLAAPSANRSGFVSPTSARHVLASLDGRIDLVLDAGPAERGLESTIIAIREDGSMEELRPGPVDLHALAHGHVGSTMEKRTQREARKTIESPGQLASHYSPGKPVRLNAMNAKSDEFFIGFGESASIHYPEFNLSLAGELSEAAAILYTALHHAAASDKPRIAIAPIPDEGVGRAINDRLRRAATPPN